MHAKFVGVEKTILVHIRIHCSAQIRDVRVAGTIWLHWVTGLLGEATIADTSQ